MDIDSNAPGHGRDYSEAVSASEGSIRASRLITSKTAPTWYSVEQAARASGYCTKTIYRALHDGELVGVKHRRRWRVRPEAVASWVEGTDASPLPIAPRRERPRPTTKGRLSTKLDHLGGAS